MLESSYHFLIAAAMTTITDKRMKVKQVAKLNTTPVDRVATSSDWLLSDPLSNTVDVDMGNKLDVEPGKREI
jgi:hypothetical protein